MDQSSSPIEIVRWGDPDLPPGLDALLQEAVETDHEWVADFRPAWEAGAFAGDGEALFVAFGGGALLAMATISADPFVEDKATGRLRFIYVRVAARRRGIAEGLVAACLGRARGTWRRLRLHTDNPVAAQLYERYGFRPAAGEWRATHIADIAPLARWP
ncbi:Acetyltransferase (GNAT) domain-containing protein [Kaistia soli DSM 19436]|uniref:Acetyltransferase (GNAT) domain-containing protein n=1 Tax=Kaistia soli DSM 19436 TaxID=1122133 RepID=A0A1M5M619_9HYPH|nr:GNAT family N-acetyltransferase [Kaistia soli]SHG72670.1 Acetyltransferase (GNAT) domain-containing protein [Kaistia soli DSM 19436]